MSTLKVISKVGTIQNSDEKIYKFLSDFRNLDRLMPPDVKDWKSELDSCQFSVKGQHVKLNIINREPFKEVKFQSSDDSTFTFFFWMQLVKVGPYKTKIRLTIHAEVNMMMKVVLKKQLQKGLDQLVDQLTVIPF
jgi:carbon monoxide dehydrogenase subunit G